MHGRSRPAKRLIQSSPAKAEMTKPIRGSLNAARAVSFPFAVAAVARRCNCSIAASRESCTALRAACSLPRRRRRGSFHQLLPMLDRLLAPLARGQPQLGVAQRLQPGASPSMPRSRRAVRGVRQDAVQPDHGIHIFFARYRGARQPARASHFRFQQGQIRSRSGLPRSGGRAGLQHGGISKISLTSAMSRLVTARRRRGSIVTSPSFPAGATPRAPDRGLPRTRPPPPAP